MTYTHGQPAVCSALGLELSKFSTKINNSFQDFNDKIYGLTCKFSGSIGNCTTLSIMFTHDEINKLYDDLRDLLMVDLIINRFARQIDDYSSYIKLLQSIQIIALNIGELADNLWLRTSRRELAMISVAGEIGSSVMAHKINPFRLEQARGWSNLIFDHCNGLIKTLGCSRDSRDMSDSVALRFFGEIFGDLAVMINNVEIDIRRLKYNEGASHEILEMNLVSLSEQIQTFLRWHYTKTIDDPYKLLEQLTKGKTITYKELHDFIDRLPISDDHKDYLKSLRADTFFGFNYLVDDGYSTPLDDII
jgi:adenylosuccinate lyase